MCKRHLGARAVAATICILLLSCVLPSAVAMTSSASADATATGTPSAEVANHTIVWTRGGNGFSLHVTQADGSGHRELYRSERGWVADLTLSQAGDQVAFVPLRTGKPQRLMIAPLDGSSGARNVLPANRYRIVSLGVMAWSPSGERIVFEALVDEPAAGGFYPSRLFTVRVDGTHLRRLPRVSGGGPNSAAFGHMAWTSDGIVFPNDRRIVLLKDGEQRLIVRNAYNVAPSGDNQWLFFNRPDTNGSLVAQLWRIRMDGSGLEQIAVPEELSKTFSFYAPNYDGTRILTVHYDEGGYTHGFAAFSVADPSDIQYLPDFAKPYTAVWR